MSSYPLNPSPASPARQRYVDGAQGWTPELRYQPADDLSRAVLLGESAVVRHLRSQVERIAPYFRTVLVRGEAGSGKRLVGEALHRLGPGGATPFVVCSATSLAEALSGQPGRAVALLDSARGGTLFLEEVGGLPSAAQAALIRLLASREPVRQAASGSPRTGLAGKEPRIIAATVRDLRTMATLAQFRSDLYARLSVIEILTPPLRQRGEDIGALAGWILDRCSRSAKLPLRALSPAAVDSLKERAWPGNLRELEQVLTRAATVAESLLIEPEDLPNPVPAAVMTQGDESMQTARPDRLQDVIQQHVLEVLARCGGNKLRASELLGISRSTLYRMLDAGAIAAPEMDSAV